MPLFGRLTWLTEHSCLTCLILSSWVLPGGHTQVRKTCIQFVLAANSSRSWEQALYGEKVKAQDSGLGFHDTMLAAKWHQGLRTQQVPALTPPMLLPLREFSSCLNIIGRVQRDFQRTGPGLDPQCSCTFFSPFPHTLAKVASLSSAIPCLLLWSKSSSTPPFAGS